MNERLPKDLGFELRLTNPDIDEAIKKIDAAEKIEREAAEMPPEVEKQLNSNWFGAVLDLTDDPDAPFRVTREEALDILNKDKEV